jgi:rod shape-determining protein MreC
VSLRDSPLGELKVPLTWTAAIAVIVAIVAVVAILVSDRRETFRAEAYGATRGVADQVLTPVGDALSAPGRWTGAGVEAVRGYFFAISENRRLKTELKEMRQWRDVAYALKNENERYRTILGLKTDPPIAMVAARIVLDSRGPFANTRLANAGTEKGIRTGNPVMSENGLVGRIMGVTTGASRVLLTTDTASKIPVMIDRTNARAILTGDGGPNPKLDYLRGQNPVKEGDRVMTSGDGGVMPRGLPVGTAVKGLDGRWRVVLAADKSPIDFVRVLLFEDFTQLVNQKELAERHVPPPTLGAQTVGVVAATAPAPPPAPKPAVAGTAPPASAKPGAATVTAPKTSAKPADRPATTKGAATATGVKTTGAKTTAAKTTAAKATSPKPATPKPAAKPAAAAADGEPPH